MLADGADIDPEKLGGFLLVEPERLGLVEHLDPDSSRLGLVQDELPVVGLLGIAHTALNILC